jgi:hypothetical protein
MMSASTFLKGALFAGIVLTQVAPAPQIVKPDPTAETTRGRVIQCVSACRSTTKITADRAAQLFSAASAQTTPIYSNAEQAFFECVDKCGSDNKLERAAILPLFGARGRRGGGGGTGTPGFSCPWGKTECTCSGFFDCKALEKSGCCTEPITSCEVTNGVEVCSCKKSPQCS